MSIRSTLLGVGVAAALGAAGAMPAGAQTLSPPDVTAAKLIYTVDLGGDRPTLERTQFFWGGRNYCWYDGWHGPGWYWCGYGWRRGFGWGGGYGWHGWRGGRGYGGYRGGGFHGGGFHGGGLRDGGFRGGDFHGGGGHEGGGVHGGGHEGGGHEGGGHHH